MEIKEKDVENFLYEGNDNMIKWGTDKTPNVVPKKFVAKLRLKNGKVIKAPLKWRIKIWRWWHDNRKIEIQDNCIISVSDQMLDKKSRL